MVGGAFKACPRCGVQAPLNAAFCSQCGHQYQTQFAPPPNQTQMFFPPPQYAQGQYRTDLIQRSPGTHSVGFAAVLSFLCILGAVQMFNGQVLKGVVLLIFGLVAGAATMGLIFLVLWPLAIIDGLCIASKLNAGQPVGQWQCF